MNQIRLKLLVCGLLIGIFFSCSPAKNVDKCSVLKSVILSKEFSKMYNLCDSKNEDVILYDATEDFLNCNSFEGNALCIRIIKVKKIDFSLDGYSLMKENRAGTERLILNMYKLKKGKFYFQFVNMLNLQTFTLSCNKNCSEISLVSQSAIDF